MKPTYQRDELALSTHVCEGWRRDSVVNHLLLLLVNRSPKASIVVVRAATPLLLLDL